MARTRPPWNGGDTEWTKTVVFSEDSRRALLEIVDAPAFIKQLEEAATHYRIGEREYENRPSRAEAILELEEIRKYVNDLQWRLKKLDESTMAELEEKVFYTNGEIDTIRNLLKNLSIIHSATFSVERNIDDSRTRKTQDYKISMCLEIKSVLERHNITPTTYPGGPFCRCIEIILSELRASVENVRHYASSALKFEA